MTVDRDKVDFRLLEWDRGPEFVGGHVDLSKDPDSAVKQWFCVRVVGRKDGKPKRIAKYDVTVSIDGLSASDIIVDEDEGWCHHNFTFRARLGEQKIVVRSGGQIVNERVVTFRDPSAMCDGDDRDKVEFRLLEWDNGPEFFGGYADFSQNPESAFKQWFCVRALGRHDGKPKRIAKDDVTVDIEGLLAGDIIVDKNEGWCHYNYTFRAKLGQYRIVIRSKGLIVNERDVTFKNVSANCDGEGVMNPGISEAASARSPRPTPAPTSAPVLAPVATNAGFAEGSERGYPGVEDPPKHTPPSCAIGMELSVYCPGERGCKKQLSNVRFGLLDDDDCEFWSRALKPSSENTNTCVCSFRVYCIRDDRVALDIAQHEVTVLVFAEREVNVKTRLEGQYLSCAFKAKFGRILVQVHSGQEIVLERVVRLKDANAELRWASKGDGADGLPAAGIAKAHYSNGQGKDGYADLQKFREWARNDEWAHFGPKHNHYDWWMFPIHTRASKPKYAVGTGEVAELKANIKFMNLYCEGVHLMLRSWGWDLDRGTWYDSRHPHQHWRNWSVRLAKVAESLATFDEMLLFNQVRDFLLALLAEERDGRQALTKAKHTQMGERIVVERQFGIDPREILMVHTEE